MYIHHIYRNEKQEYVIVVKGLEIHINKEEINKESPSRSPLCLNKKGTIQLFPKRMIFLHNEDFIKDKNDIKREGLSPPSNEVASYHLLT